MAEPSARGRGPVRLHPSTPRLRIAVVGSRGIDVQGGIETYCRQIYPRLARRGCELTIFSRRSYSPTRGMVDGVRVIPLWSPKTKWAEAPIHTLLAVLAARRCNADIVHFHAVGSGLFVPLARALGMKTVLRHVGQDWQRPKWGAVARIVLRLGEYLGVRFGDAVVCISQEIAHRVHKRRSVGIFVIPNGVSKPPAVRSQGVLRHYNLGTQGYVLGIGRIVPEKGLDILVDAHLRMLEDTRPKLVIVGGPSSGDRAYADLLVQKAAGVDDIIFTGELASEAIHELLTHASILVVPSFHEGMSFVALEGLAFGVPTLLSDIPGNRELGLPARCYFSPGDPDELATRLARASLQRPERTELLVAANAAAKRFSAEATAAATYRVFEGLLQKPKFEAPTHDAASHNLVRGRTSA